jgi:membrane peptidoglycan carboxypeptidase
MDGECAARRGRRPGARLVEASTRLRITLRRMSPASRIRNVIGLLVAFVVASMVLGVLAAGLFLPAVGATGVTASKSVDFFNSLPGTLKQPPLPQQTKVLSSDGKVIAKFFDQNRINVDLEQISKPMQQAVISIEDARFYHHGGVDPQGLMRAFLVNQFHKGVVQGASTLTQQYVKNVLVQTAYVAGDKEGQRAATADNNARKVKEIRYAVSLEKQMSKNQILNRYLNIAWFGGVTYGVEAAGLHYFNTHAKDLTIPQAALLAGMIQNAQEWSPTAHPDQAKERRNVVLRVMRDQSVITQAEFDKYSKQGLGLNLQPLRNGCANTGRDFGFYCDYIKNLIIHSGNDFRSIGTTEDKRSIALLRGGLTIKTTLSPKIQVAAMKAVNDRVPSRNSPGVGAAAVTVEPGTGRVLAIAENRTWDPNDKKQGHTSTNWAVDYKFGGSVGFQTGSTFKPFTLATWLKQGKSLNASVSSETGTAPFSAFHSCVQMDRSQSYTYYNSEGRGHGNISVFQATYASVNGAYVSMEKQLNLCDIVDTAESFGVHRASAEDNNCDASTAKTTQLPRCNPSLTLGVYNISPMTMAAAYAGFAAQGLYCKPVAISAIIDRDGNTLAIPQPSCKQVLDKKVANTLNYGLSRVFKPGGTAARVGPLPGGREASGKTGTSNDSQQTWFCGYTTKLSTAVWVGLPRPGNTSLNHKKIDGHVTRVFGATYAAPIWKQIMTTATKGTPKERFAKPDSDLTKVPTKAVPNVAGMSVKAAISRLKAAGFNPTADGGFVNSKYPAGRVAGTSPPGGSRVQPGTTVQISISNGHGGGGGGGNRGNGGGLVGGLFPGGNG